MKYKPFKKLKLSTLGMGNMRLPVTGDKNIDEARAQEMIDFAMESGINYYDTATATMAVSLSCSSARRWRNIPVTAGILHPRCPAI